MNMKAVENVIVSGRSDYSKEEVGEYCARKMKQWVSTIIEEKV